MTVLTGALRREIRTVSAVALRIESRLPHGEELAVLRAAADVLSAYGEPDPGSTFAAVVDACAGPVLLVDVAAIAGQEQAVAAAFDAAAGGNGVRVGLADAVPLQRSCGEMSPLVCMWAVGDHPLASLARSVPLSWVDAVSQWAESPNDTASLGLVRELCIERRSIAASLRLLTRSISSGSVWNGEPDEPAARWTHASGHVGAVAFARPVNSDAEALTAADELRALIATLDPPPVYAAGDISVGYGAGIPDYPWRQEDDAKAPSVGLYKGMFDVLVPDVHVWQALGPAHVATLPDVETSDFAHGLRGLQCGEWTLDLVDRDAPGRQTGARRRLREHGRALLGGCLVSLKQLSVLRGQRFSEQARLHGGGAAPA